MDLTQLKLFKTMNTRMHWLNQRQKVLAENVANADTPKYAARDLSPIDFQSILRDRIQSTDMSRTHQLHQEGRPTGAGAVVLGEKQHFQATPTGNSVVLEEEMIKVAETTSDYETMTNLYRKAVGLFRIAISTK
jgi:flagellar basal-body rod protein FlgB